VDESATRVRCPPIEDTRDVESIGGYEGLYLAVHPWRHLLGISFGYLRSWVQFWDSQYSPSDRILSIDSLVSVRDAAFELWLCESVQHLVDLVGHAWDGIIRIREHIEAGKFYPGILLVPVIPEYLYEEAMI